MTEEAVKDDVDTRRVVRMVLGGLTLSHFGTNNFDPIYFGRVLAIPLFSGVITASAKQTARIAAQEYLGDMIDQEYHPSQRSVFREILDGLEFHVKHLRGQSKDCGA